jgi:hypothetical protein
VKESAFSPSPFSHLHLRTQQGKLLPQLPQILLATGPAPSCHVSFSNPVSYSSTFLGLQIPTVDPTNQQVLGKDTKKERKKKGTVNAHVQTKACNMTASEPESQCTGATHS